jgi:hypothetical protein
MKKVYNTTEQEMREQAKEEIIEALTDGYTGYYCELHNNATEAAAVANAIKEIASKPQNLENLESYLSMHFTAWLEKFANTPDGMAAELKAFAEMDI